LKPLIFAKLTRDIVGTDVNDDCTWLEPFSLYELWYANSSNYNVCGFELEKEIEEKR
jgi:hypothetical protein